MQIFLEKYESDMYNSDNVYNSDKHVRTKEYKPLKPIGKTNK